MTGGRMEGFTREALEDSLDYVDRVMAKISHARMNRPDSALFSDTFRNAAAFLRHACRLGMARFDAEGHGIAQIPLRSRQALADDLRQIIEEYQHVWLARNRPGGLDDSPGRIEELATAYRT